MWKAKCRCSMPPHRPQSRCCSLLIALTDKMETLSEPHRYSCGLVASICRICKPRAAALRAHLAGAIRVALEDHFLSLGLRHCVADGLHHLGPARQKSNSTEIELGSKSNGSKRKQQDVTFQEISNNIDSALHRRDRSPEVHGDTIRLREDQCHRNYNTTKPKYNPDAARS